MKVTFKSSEDSAKDTRTFWFEKPQNIHHIAGQFIELYLPHKNPDDKGERRWFTLSSSPTEPMLSITTKLHDDNTSFKKTLRNLVPGTQLDMAEPMGDFVLPKDASIPLLFVAGGIGITPFRSISKWLIDNDEERDIALIYAVKSQGHIAFQEILSKYGPNFHKLIGQRLSGPKIFEVVPDAPQRYIYLSGPEPMVERLQKELIESGYDKKNLYVDFFHGYADS